MTAIMSQPVSYPCPNCGVAYALTTEYLAEWGGQVTACSICGASFPLPAGLPVAPPMPAPPPFPGGAAAGGALPVLGYASPAYAMQALAMAWADGRIVVARKGANLSHCCVKCGAPNDGRPLHKTLYWHQPWVWATILAGLLVYVIIAMCIRESGTIDMGLCKAHRARRRRAALGGTALAVLGVGLFFVAGVRNEPLWVPLGIIGLLGGIVWAAIGMRVLTPTRIDTQYLWLKGAGEPFLRTLPSINQQHAATNAYAAAQLGQPG